MSMRRTCAGIRPSPVRICATLAQVASVIALGAALVLSTARPAAAIVIGGGGSSRTDCLLALDAPANDPISKPRNIECTDGDPSCDADGVVNGVCEFQISLCANSTYSSDCTLNGVQTIVIDHSADNGDPKFDTEFQAMANRVESDIAPPTTTSDKCTNPTTFHVSLEGPLNGVCKKAKKQLKITTVSKLISGHIYTDKDKIKMTCNPDPNVCDPRQFFSGTFDRIQTQIFNQSCAVSGCHDSQSHTGNMVLESGSSLASLINVTPDNPAAAAAGWKRVTVIDMSTGDPDTSLIVAKLNGPPKNFGARMPKDRPKLDQSLIDVIQLWVAAGAPDTGWVPGTDQ